MTNPGLIAMQQAVQRDWTPDSHWHIGDLAWQSPALAHRTRCRADWHLSVNGRLTAPAHPQIRTLADGFAIHCAGVAHGDARID